MKYHKNKSLSLNNTRLQVLGKKTPNYIFLLNVKHGHTEKGIPQCLMMTAKEPICN